MTNCDFNQPGVLRYILEEKHLVDVVVDDWMEQVVQPASVQHHQLALGHQLIVPMQTAHDLSRAANRYSGKPK